MSFFSRASQLAKKAAAVAVETTKQTYNTLTSRPTSVTCGVEGCGTVIPVPAELWAWTCSAGHPNADGAAGAKCDQCEAKREVAPAPSVTCEKCQATTLVASTVAGNYATDAVAITKKAAKDTAEYSKQTYNELKSRPETILCPHCKTVSAIPAELWDWTCEDGHANKGDVTTCSQCPKTRQQNPQVSCPGCQAVLTVPTTVAGVKLNVAVADTKKAANQAATATKEQINHWKSTPEEFNCQKCNAKLMVPPPQEWMCQTAGCGCTNTPDKSECESCKSTYKPQVMCGVCMTVTDIPHNNFMNSVRSTKLSTKQAYQDAKKTANFVADNKEEIKAAGKFAQDNPELTKAAVNAAKAAK